MAPWTDHSAPEGWIVVPLNTTELALMSSMRAVISVKPVTTPASKLTINPILVMACGFACSSSAFIVPLHDNVRTSALMGEAEQINVRATNSIRDMAGLRHDQHIEPMASATLIQYGANPKLDAFSLQCTLRGAGTPFNKFLNESYSYRGCNEPSGNQQPFGFAAIQYRYNDPHHAYPDGDQPRTIAPPHLAALVKKLEEQGRASRVPGMGGTPGGGV